MSKNINIIYITHSEKKPSGGGKIIYKHCENINSLKNTLSSEIIHIKKKRLVSGLVQLKKNSNFIMKNIQGGKLMISR